METIKVRIERTYKFVRGGGCDGCYLSELCNDAKSEHCTHTDWLENIFPELKESEDEMIRKTLIHIVKGACDKYGIKYQGKDIISEEKLLAWLEKLGDKAFSVERVFAEAGIKPAYKDGDSWCVLIGENIQEGVCGFGETQKDAYVNFLKQLWGKAFEQNPAWSEENEERLDSIIESYKDLIKDYKACHDVDYIPYNSDTVSRNVVDDVNFLKSLKERALQQPKQEWSQTDNELADDAIACVTRCYEEYNNEFYQSLHHNTLDIKRWLIDVRRRLTPQWKPSDEHYELKEFAKIVRGNLTGISKDVQELFEAKYLQLTGNKMYGGYKD